MNRELVHCPLRFATAQAYDPALRSPGSLCVERSAEELSLDEPIDASHGNESVAGALSDSAGAARAGFSTRGYRGHLRQPAARRTESGGHCSGPAFRARWIGDLRCGYGRAAVVAFADPPRSLTRSTREPLPPARKLQHTGRYPPVPPCDYRKTERIVREQSTFRRMPRFFRQAAWPVTGRARMHTSMTASRAVCRGLFAALGVVGIVIGTPATAAAPTAADARAFVARAEADLSADADFQNHAAWVQATYINSDTNWINAKIGAESTDRAVRYAKGAAEFDHVQVDEVTARKLYLLKQGLVLPAPSVPGPRKSSPISPRGWIRITPRRSWTTTGGLRLSMTWRSC